MLGAVRSFSVLDVNCCRLDALCFARFVVFLDRFSPCHHRYRPPYLSAACLTLSLLPSPPLARVSLSPGPKPATHPHCGTVGGTTSFRRRGRSHNNNAGCRSPTVSKRRFTWHQCLALQTLQAAYFLAIQRIECSCNRPRTVVVAASRHTVATIPSLLAKHDRQILKHREVNTDRTQHPPSTRSPYKPQ